MRRNPDTDQNTERIAGENIFVKEETRTVTQDIRPLQILVLNPDTGEDRNEDARLFHVSHLLGRTGGPVLSLRRPEGDPAPEDVRRVRAPGHPPVEPAGARL